MQASSQMRRVPVDSVPTKWSAYGAEAQVVDRGPAPGRAARGRGAARSGGRPAPRACAVGSTRSCASATVSSTVRSPNRRASWNERPRPRSARGVGGERADVVAEQLDAPVGRDEPADGVHDRGLAGAVGADEPDDLVLVDVEVDAVDDAPLAEADA